MSKRTRKPADIAEQLRAAALNSGQTMYALAKGAGIDRAVMVRYLNEDRDMRLTTAAKLAAYLGLELRPAKGGK